MQATRRTARGNTGCVRQAGPGLIPRLHRTVRTTIFTALALGTLTAAPGAFAGEKLTDNVSVFGRCARG